MQYYKLKESLDENIVGTQFPQVWDFVKGYSPKVENNGIFSLYDMYVPGIPDIEPNLSGLKLSSGSKWTDLLSNGYSFNLFIVDEKVRDALERLNIPSHRYYKANIHSMRRKEVKEYYLLKVCSQNVELVDFSRSKFYIRNYDQEANLIKTPIRINNLKEYIEKYCAADDPDEWVDVWSSKIKLTKEFCEKKLDLFSIGGFDNDWYVSKRFVNVIEDAGLTGFEFEPVQM